MVDKSEWVWADFNGLFSGILCLSHEDTCKTASGKVVGLYAGMQLTAYDEDGNEKGERDDIFASGIVEPSPEWLVCRGSRWILRIDENGIRWESELKASK
jgi:hypothetical protein